MSLHSRLSEITATDREDIVYIHFLRIASTFGVVLLHAAAYEFESVEIASSDWMLLNCMRSIVTTAVPIFVMISGALSLGKDYDFKAIGKKILRIVTAFFFWSAVYTVHIYRYGADLESCINSFFKGCYHMWFCPMIIGLYLIIPFLRKITESVESGRYFVLLSFIFAFFIPRLTNTVIINHIPSAADVINYTLQNMHFHFVLGYAGYFVAGYYLHSMKIQNKAVIPVVILTAICLCLVIILSRNESIKSGTISELYYTSFSCFVYIASLGVFISFKRFCPEHINPGFLKVIKKISQSCFGAYLAHVLVLESCFSLVPEFLRPYHGFAALYLSVIAFLISCAISFIIRLIPGLGKHVT